MDIAYEPAVETRLVPIIPAPALGRREIEILPAPRLVELVDVGR